MNLIKAVAYKHPCGKTRVVFYEAKEPHAIVVSATCYDVSEECVAPIPYPVCLAQANKVLSHEEITALVQAELRQRESGPEILAVIDELHTYRDRPARLDVAVKDGGQKHGA
jgi:hypothetical protein